MPREEDEAKGSDSDDDLLACCNALEDLLLDDIMPADIYCGDQDSGEEGKGEELEPGQQLFVQVQTVCRKALPFFVDAVRDGLNVGEYLPEHQEFHEQYMGIIEDAMSKKFNSFAEGMRVKAVQFLEKEEGGSDEFDYGRRR
ncbi:hypothetical protein TrRE_jg6873 [Triparma retinervis]|uniref:Uncharacterized protein n=1 Tax=Triparma retinervis TaxID=2557542 RepID=A0A9W6ZCZ0_9STRA|nr:hypothetical protein TrRE_jg6873 [Triparma retinervis]